MHTRKMLLWSTVEIPFNYHQPPAFPLYLKQIYAFTELSGTRCERHVLEVIFLLLLLLLLLFPSLYAYRCNL